MLDLNVPESLLAADAVNVLRMFKRLGYRGLAITVQSDGNLNKSKPCRIDKARYAEAFAKAHATTPASASAAGPAGAGQAQGTIVRTSPMLLAQLSPAGLPHPFAARSFDIYTRLSVVLDNPSHNYSLSSNSQIIASYDLVSVQPMTEKLFQAACQQLDVDLITLDMGTRLPFYFKGPTINAAIQRGVAFEITYSQGIRDATARRHLFSNAAALVRVTKGKHIVLSSAAAHAIELRGPFDVMNLATIFGMNMAQAKAAMTDTVRSVLLHAATRKDSYRGVLSMEQMDTKKRPADDAGGVSGAEDEQQGQAWKAARLEDQDFVAFDFGDEDDDEGHDDGDDDDGGMDA